jgi:hypothetical protein
MKTIVKSADGRNYLLSGSNYSIVRIDGQYFRVDNGVRKVSCLVEASIHFVPAANLLNLASDLWFVDLTLLQSLDESTKATTDFVMHLKEKTLKLMTNRDTPPGVQPCRRFGTDEVRMLREMAESVREKYQPVYAEIMSVVSFNYTPQGAELPS